MDRSGFVRVVLNINNNKAEELWYEVFSDHFYYNEKVDNSTSWIENEFIEWGAQEIAKRAVKDSSGDGVYEVVCDLEVSSAHQDRSGISHDASSSIENFKMQKLSDEVAAMVLKESKDLEDLVTGVDSEQ